MRRQHPGATHDFETDPIYPVFDETGLSDKNWKYMRMSEIRKMPDFYDKYESFANGIFIKRQTKLDSNEP